MEKDIKNKYKMIYFPPIMKQFDVPIGNHFGSFGARRKYSIHCGIDIYANENTPVSAIEDGEVVEVKWFTGAYAGTDWWLPTRCVSVEGNTGVIVYINGCRLEMMNKNC